MSTYINEYAVLDAIKAILDADSTLDNLLHVVGSTSKVILGMERPKRSNLPVVHLSFLIRDVDAETKLNNILTRATWFVSAYPDGREDIEKLADIGERIYDLLDDASLSVSNYLADFFCAESGESSAKDMQMPEGRDEHFQSLTFRMAIRRIN